MAEPIPRPTCGSLGNALRSWCGISAWWQTVSGRFASLTAQGPSGKRYEFEARQEPDGLYRISRLGRSEAVQVLASPACGLAMTADYDLFLVAPSIEAHGSGGLDARRNTAVRYTPSVQRIP